MSVRESLRPRLWPSASPTARVSGRVYCSGVYANSGCVDANGFKEAFIKAQQENEALFGKSEQ
jgi:hypothetical protein